MYYRQCKLRKGIFHTTTWIPERFAHVGKYIKLKREGAMGHRKWDNGWRVEEVGARMSEKDVLERSQDYKHQRSGSDI